MTSEYITQNPLFQVGLDLLVEGYPGTIAAMKWTDDGWKYKVAYGEDDCESYLEDDLLVLINRPGLEEERLWMVVYSIPYEGGDISGILGIFDSLDLAQAVIDKLDNDYRKSYLSIVEMIVNEECEVCV